MGWVKTDDLERFANGFAAKVTSLFAKKTEIPKSLPASGGDAATVGGHTVGADVPAGAKFTDTTYTHPTGPGNEHIPSGGKSGQILRCNDAGRAEWGDDTDTKYTVMKAASSSADGASGLVPAPTMGMQDSFLKGDGTWKEMGEVTDSEIDAIIAGSFK